MSSPTGERGSSNSSGEQLQRQIQVRANSMTGAATNSIRPTQLSENLGARSSNDSQIQRGHWVWQKWPARIQPFRCFGHVVLLARDHGTLWMTIILIAGNGAIFLGGVAQYVHPAVLAIGIFIAVLPLFMLLLTTFTEAGILPRRSLAEYPVPQQPVQGNNGRMGVHSGVRSMSSAGAMAATDLESYLSALFFCRSSRSSSGRLSRRPGGHTEMVQHLQPLSSLAR
jgi:hypothetical protein